MQNTRARVRLRYRKDDVLRYIGHRDLLRLVLRLLRRAEVPFALSAGYSPKPRLTFGPALPLGVLADNELLDIELRDGMEADDALVAELQARLTEVSAPRDFVAGLGALGADDKPVSKLAVGSRYVFENEHARKLLEEALAAGTLPVNDDKKGQEDYAPRITAWRLEDGALELDGMNGQNALNVTVLARWVAQRTPAGYIPDVRRKCLLDGAGNEL